MMDSIVDVIKRDVRSAARLFEWIIRWKKMQFSKESIISIFRKTVANNPNKIAIKFGDKTWTFKQLDEFSNRIANCFLSFGLKAGDEVALLMNNKPEFIGIWIGLAKVGIITAFVNTNNRRDFLIDSFTSFKCKAVIYDLQYNNAIEELYDVLKVRIPSLEYFVWTENETNFVKISSTQFTSVSLAQLLDNFSEDSLDVSHKRNFNDTLLYVFTSGTTGGKVKAAIQTDARLILGVIGHQIGFRFKNKDNFYIPLPLYHAFAGVLVVGHCILFGNTISIAEKFSASNYWTDCIKYNCTIGLYIGETCRYVLAQPSKPEDTLHSIKTMYGIGLKKEFWNQFKTRFAIKHIYEFYGSSEANLNILNINNREGSCGFLPYYYGWLLRVFIGAIIIKVDDITLAPVRNSKGLCQLIRPGEIGVMVGKHRKNAPDKEFKGYTDEEQTNKCFIHNILSRGDSGFITGDLLEIDKFGYVYFRDRSGDTFRWKGENVSTTDVESVLQNYFNIKECVVFGVTVGQCDGKAGMAVIDANHEDINFDLLADHLIKCLPSYAIPLFIKISDCVEVTTTFKLIKYKHQKAGYQPSSDEDMIYFFNKSTKSYTKLTKQLFDLIESGQIMP